MNKKILTTFYFCILSTFIFAQPYFRLSGGYNFPQPNMVFAHSSTDTSTIAAKGSLGKGFTPAVNVGYNINEHLGFEVSFNYLFGQKLNAFAIFDTNSINISFNAKRFCINPSLVFNSKIISNKLNLKGQLGLIVSPKTLLYRQMLIGNSTEQLVKMKTKFNLGYFGTLGLQYQPKGRLSYQLDVIANSTTVYLKSAEIVKYTFLGEDYLSQMKNEDKKWNYVTELKNNSNNNDQIVESYLMNSVGLNLGIQYSLHK